jgi:hypothetical protein
MAGTREERTPHAVLHAFLVAVVLVTIYPVLWVVTIAFSGSQSLSIVDLPADPTNWDRLRAIVPWPARWSGINFASVMADQPFARWMLNSAVIAVATTLVVTPLREARWDLSIHLRAELGALLFFGPFSIVQTGPWLEFGGALAITGEVSDGVALTADLGAS